MSTCHYFNTPQGCRRNPCRFLHESPGNAGHDRGPAKTAPTRKSAPIQLNLDAPKGVCRYYYNFGNCKKDPCTFRHLEPGDARVIQQIGFRGVTALNNGTGAPNPGMELMPAGFQIVSPSDALQHLSTFCAPRALFTKPFQIMKFVNLLTNAGLKDGTWDEKDAQTFLEIVTETQGLSRIEAILTFDPVVVQVGPRRDAISFASAYIPCLAYFVSGFVLDSTLATRVNSLYGLLHSHFAHISTTITTCMGDIVARKSFEDEPFTVSCGAQIFGILVQVLVEYISRYKSAFRDQQTLLPLAESLSSWINLWKAGGFIDTDIDDLHARRVTRDRLDRDLERLLSMATRESKAFTRKSGIHNQNGSRGPHSASLIGPLAIHYDPAGNLRPDGPRHDNDIEDIRVTSIPPTEAEMTCKVSPFLPANIPGAPHHLAAESMERLLDIQFRLLREELIAPLRLTLQMIISDLRSASKKTLLHSLIARKGGRYIAETSNSDSVMASVYTSANPVSITTDRRGMAVEILIDTPPGQARSRSATQRAEYWKAISRKRLIQGGLIGIVWATQTSIQLFFGLISSGVEDLQSSSRQSADSLRLRIKFFDETINPKVMEWCQLRSQDRRGITILMVEASVMYESIRPFLKALQREPTSFPFSRYLVHRSHNSRHHYQSVEPPRYTSTRRDFTWNLRCIVNEGVSLILDPRDPNSIQDARQSLRSSSRLDPSQADAMVDCLTRDFCLIQGPPGTGKSYTGVEIMRVLVANNVGKILLIAFTNHALDHLLESVLKMGITSKIARLGSRSSNEELKQYSLDTLERLDSSSTEDKSNIHRAYRALKTTEKELHAVLKQLQGGEVSEDDRTEYMELFVADQYDELMHPPQFVHAIRALEEGWSQVGPGKANGQTPLHDFWRMGRDIIWVEQMHSSTQVREERQLSNRFVDLAVDEGEDDEASSFEDDLSDFGDSPSDLEDEEGSELRSFLEAAGLSALPPIPSSDRPLDQLREDETVWAMSLSERTRLANAWEEGARQYFFTRNQNSFTYLKAKYEDAKQTYEECQDQTKLRILNKVDIIGCTTTGAAKLTALLSGTRPSVLLVEEAGQVLEAHILGSLVPSVEHVIMIGDPLQLRPTINNYSLSMDHSLGGKIYKFDQSTMERLANAGMGMSMLSVQRRMRPEIASVARTTLYPTLEDNELVTKYPAVRGLARNIFFFHHTHAEGGADEESVSKYNAFEITMIKALVHHLLRQGTYTKSGSIVVLCMYLGQLAKLRDELRKSRINVILDARDEEELRNREGDATSSDEDSPIQVVDVKVTDQASRSSNVTAEYSSIVGIITHRGQLSSLLVTGEEADIVILSLVRNHGPDRPGTIGFLKSPNRVNVALTRAKHGLFVFGNGDLLSSKSDMWTKVIDYFKELDSYGTALPIACHMHQESIQWVNNADKLRQVSPDGEKPPKILMFIVFTFHL
ncbi:hypothetical protein FRC17_000149 [Serendipita sp. 399]|nr:hypothetical protein FRC17_000149 [Serendipita sp. 399]